MSVSSMGQARTVVSAVAVSASSDVEGGCVTRSAFGRSREIQHKIKRAFDVVVSLSAIVVLLPLLIFVVIAIKATSSGPVFFKQVRWGAGGRKIEVMKFRSMRVDACDVSGVAQTIKNDPRITPIGSWLRRSNVDELPQLLNVLKGDMSLIGPRCHPVGMLAAGKPYEELVHNYHLRHAMRPGMTGLAQIRGLRGPTIQASKARQRIACDLYYIQHYSLWLDLKIILGTIRNEVFGGSGF